MSNYYSPEGGLPPQTQLLTDRAVVKEAYTVIPKGVLRDIVTSQPPRLDQNPRLDHRPAHRRLRHHLLAADRGGRRRAAAATKPEAEAGVEGVIFLTKGELT